MCSFNSIKKKVKVKVTHNEGIREKKQKELMKV